MSNVVESVKSEGGERRSYSSSTRDEGARQTRAAVTDAARELFLSRGYAATSLADIARVAGVSRPTVFAAFGSKARLLGAVLDQALAGDDTPVAVAERPWFRPVWDARTPAAALTAYAAACTVIAHQAADAFEAVRRAADDSPEVAELWSTLQDNRVSGARMVVDHLVTLGDLRPGLDVAAATDVLWVFNDPALFRSLVGERAWPVDRYRDWLAAQMQAAVLDS